MTLCYKIFPAHIYISTCVFAWGIIASLQSLVSDFASMLVLRTLLGISEAAFVGMPIYLSFFFKRRELAFRTGVFVAAAPLATSFASTLAYLIVNFGDRVPIDNWRLLFLVEGFPACLVAIFAWSWLPDSPGQARWLTLNERKIADRRMRRDTGQEKLSRLGASSRHTRKLDWTAVWAPLKDPKSYMTAGMFFCCNVAFSSMPVFLPTIVNNMGNSPLASQGLSAPPMLFAFVVVLVTAFLSDRIGSRSGPLLFHTLMAMAGYVVLALAGPLQLGTVVRYMAVFPVCAGFFSAVTIVITWTVNNQESDEGKGTGMAVLNVFGQMGPVLGTRLYPDRDAPYYGSGMVVCASAMAMAAALALVLRVYLQRENKRRMRYQRVDGEEESTGGHKKGKKPFELMI
jgi:MFS family permease